jgi:hypothetical protein
MAARKQLLVFSCAIASCITITVWAAVREVPGRKAYLSGDVVWDKINACNPEFNGIEIAR